jgi:transcriptional regulator GlxA family with amidase domain
MNRSIHLFGTLLFGFAQLVSAAASAANEAHHPKKVAFLLFEHAEVIDYAGPYEVFGMDDGEFDTYTVAATTAPVKTTSGLTVVPTYSFATAPQADILIIPGGMVRNASHDKATLNWIKAQTAHTLYTMTVCNGAFILANAGLLDGLSATTTRTHIQELHELHPQIKVVRDQRVVDNGKIVTTGGTSAGIDGALHIVGKILGEGNAQQDALYLEYDAKHERNYLPATFAVLALPRVEEDLMKLGTWDLLRTEGDAKHWELAARVNSKLSLVDLKNKLDTIYARAGNWQAAPNRETAATGATASSWRFQDAEARQWNTSLRLQPDNTNAGQYVFSITVDRAS